MRGKEGLLSLAQGIVFWGPPPEALAAATAAVGGTLLLFFTLVTGPRRSLSLKLSDTRVYEPQIDTSLHVSTRRGALPALLSTDRAGSVVAHKRCTNVGAPIEAHRLLYYPA